MDIYAIVYVAYRLVYETARLPAYFRAGICMYNYVGIIDAAVFVYLMSIWTHYDLPIAVLFTIIIPGYYRGLFTK